MTNTALLNDKIEQSGYRRRFIAAEINLSYQAFLNKVNNESEFKISEVKGLCSLLKISKTEREQIFFS